MAKNSRVRNERSGKRFPVFQSEFPDPDNLLTPKNNILSKETKQYLRAMADISDVKNDPEYESANNSAVMMIAGHMEEGTAYEKNKKFIRDSLTLRSGTNISRNARVQFDEGITTDNADKIASNWVNDWNEKKESDKLNDPVINERRNFISNSLRGNKNNAGKKAGKNAKIFSFTKPFIKYAVLAAALVVGAIFVVRSLLPAYDQQDLFNMYYKPYEAISPVTRGSEEDNNDLFNIAVDNYRSGNYTTAAALFSKTMLDKQTEVPSKFFLGLTEIELNNPGRAVELLEAVANTPGEYSGDAQWYLGLACLKKGDRDKAGQSFMILSQAKGFYSEPSMKILRRLK